MCAMVENSPSPLILKLFDAYIPNNKEDRRDYMEAENKYTRDQCAQILSNFFN